MNYLVLYNLAKDTIHNIPNKNVKSISYSNGRITFSVKGSYHYYDTTDSPKKVMSIITLAKKLLAEGKTVEISLEGLAPNRFICIRTPLEYDDPQI